MSLRLVIANKAYSSWSLRPWIALRHFGVPFEEIVIPLREPSTRARISSYSPTGRVPALIDGELAIWDSLAILEYLAEIRPDLPIWPRAASARAIARSEKAKPHGSITSTLSPRHAPSRRTAPTLPAISGWKSAIRMACR